MTLRIPYFVLILTGCFSTEAVAGENDWPRLHGNNGSGVSTAGGELPVNWESSNFQWQTEIPGTGHGSPTIWGDRIFLLSAVASASEKKAAPAGKKKKSKGKSATPYSWLALCLDKNSGKMLWKKEFPQRAFKGHKFNSAASSTPAADSDRVVFTWGTADALTMVALSHEGEELWSTDLGPVVGGHGYGGSPILYKGLVVLNNDQEKQNGNLLAVDAKTGGIKWTVERKSERISYSVPCIYPTPDGDRLIFTNWQHGFTAIDPNSGKVIADKSVFNTDTNERAISSPLMAGDDLVIGTCGFTANPKHCVAMRLNGNEWEEVWRIERNVPHIPSLVVVNEMAFLIDDSGIGTCVDALSGEEFWKERIPGVEGKIFGSPVSDGKNIFFADESGNIHVVAATKEFAHLATNALGETCKTTPAISGGTIFVRTATKLHAVKN